MLFNRFAAADAENEGRDNYFMDIDRMVNEGLGGGRVSRQNGVIDDTTTDTMDESESVGEEAPGAVDVKGEADD